MTNTNTNTTVNAAREAGQTDTYTKLTSSEWLAAGRAGGEGLKQFAKRRPEMIFALALAKSENLPAQLSRTLQGFQHSSGWLAGAATEALAGSKMACISVLQATRRS